MCVGEQQGLVVMGFGLGVQLCCVGLCVGGVQCIQVLVCLQCGQLVCIVVGLVVVDQQVFFDIGFWGLVVEGVGFILWQVVQVCVQCILVVVVDVEFVWSVGMVVQYCQLYLVVVDCLEVVVQYCQFGGMVVLLC